MPENEEKVQVRTAGPPVTGHGYLVLALLSFAGHASEFPAGTGGRQDSSWELSPNLPSLGLRSGNGLMKSHSPIADRIGSVGCKAKLESVLAVGEHLANSVHLFPTGRDPMTGTKRSRREHHDQPE